MTSLSEEEENYVRMGLLLTGISPRAVRALFDHEFHPSCLDASIKNENNKLLEMKKKNIINRTQWNLLFPRFPDVTKSDTFDVTLMITLLRNLTNLRPPCGGYEQLPAAIETTPSSDLARIKHYRNYVAHLEEAKIDNMFFIFAWNDISKAIGRLGGQSLKQECDQLRTKTLDQSNKEIIIEIKQSKDEIDELKQSLENLKISHTEYQKMNDTKMDELKAEQDEFIPKNIRDQTNVKIKKWKKRDKLFVSTRASDYVMNFLQDNSCVMLTGYAGVGKSFIAKHTALVLRKKGYSIIPVISPSEIRVYYQPNKQTVFIVDDMCGHFVANRQQIENWVQLLPVIKDIVVDKCCKIIISCRLQVFKDDKFNMLPLFKSFECNLMSDKLCLTAKEKTDIAVMYIGKNSKNIDEKAKQCEFFPLLCKLYDKKKHIDVNEYFKNPFLVYKKELDKLGICGKEGKLKVCSLALCVIFNNRLTEKWFEGEVTNQQLKIIEDTCGACSLNRGTSKAEIQKALSTLEGTFICKRYGYYRALHDKLFDFLAHYFGQKMIKCLINHGDRYLIEERFVWQDSPDDKDSNTEFIIEITDSNLEAYVKRLIKDWSNGMVIFVFGSKYMKVSSFRQHLLHNLLQMEKSEQVALINTKDTMIKHDIHQSGDYPLIRACKHGYIDIVQWMLDNDAHVDQCKDDGVSAMYMACQEGYTTILNMLLEKKSNVDICNGVGESILYKACQKGSIDIVKLLLESNSTVNLCDHYGFTPLINSCINNNLSIVQLLLQHKPDINAQTHDGSSALYFSALYGHVEIAQLLLVNQADCNLCIYNKDKLRYLYTNHASKSLSIHIWNASDTLQTNAPLNVQGYFEKKQTHHDRVDSFYSEAYTNKAFHVVAGSSPLHIACFVGRADVARCLLQHKSNIHKANEDRKTPLSYACELGHTDIVKLLLEMNSNVDQRDNDGFTPLIKSSLNGHTSTVQLLLKHKPDINARTFDGGSALFFSALNGNLKITQLLLDNSADCNMCFNSKDTFKKHALLNRKKKEISNILVNSTSTFVADYVRRERLDISLETGPMRNTFFSIKKYVYYALDIVAGSSPLHIACFMGRTNIVRCLLEHKANINMTKTDGTTPLSYACELGYEDIVKMLLEKNANINLCDNDGSSPLIKSCMNNHTGTVQLLIQHKPDVNVRAVDCTKALFFSALNGNLEISKLLLENNADCNNCIHSKQFITDSLSDHPQKTSGKKQRDFFYIFVICTSTNITQFVRYKSFNSVLDLFAGSSSLHIACFMGHLDVVHCILENKADINKANEYGTTPLSYACERGHTDIVKLLLDKHAILDSLDNDGFTPLIKACLNNNTSAVQLLIKHKADIDARTYSGGNALFFSALNGNLDITHLLLKNCADCNICFHSKDRLINTIYNKAPLSYKKYKIFKRLVNNTSTNAAGYVRGKPFVYKTKISGYTSSVYRKSVDYAFDVVAGSSPLHIACFMGWTDVVRCLLEHKANINMPKEDGTTPLSYACEVGNTDIVKLLLEKNANVDINDNDGFTPLIKSCMNNNTSVVQLLIQHTPDINARIFDGGSALIFGVLNGNLEITHILLHNNADCNICIYSKECMICSFENHAKKSFQLEKQDKFDRFRDNSLSFVIQHVRKKSLSPFCTKFLKNFSIRKKVFDYVLDVVAGSYPLHLACFMGWTDVVSCLLENKANVNMTKEDGTTPLSYACELGHTDIVQILLDQNANVDISDNDGFTPLIKACMNNNTSVVQLLIQHTPDINARALHGLTALFFSAMHGNLEIVQLLLMNGADCNICSNSKEYIKDAIPNYAEKTLKHRKNDIVDILNNLLLIAKKFDIDNSILYASKTLFNYDSEESAVSDSDETVDYILTEVIHYGTEDLENYDSDECVYYDSQEAICFDNEEAVNYDSQEVLDHDSEEAVDHDSEEALDHDSEETVDHNSKEAVDHDRQEALGHNDDEALYHESQDAVDHDSEESLDHESQEAVDHDSDEAIYYTSEEAVDRDSEEAVDLDPEEAVDQDSEEALDTDSEDAVDRDSEEAVNHDSEKAVDQDNEEALDADSEETLFYERQEAVDHDSEEAVDHDSEEALDHDSQETVDHDSEEAVDRVFDLVTSSSPLHVACFMGRKDVACILLEHKANMNMTKEDGTTPLFYACEVGHESTVRLLLEKGADTQMCRLDGKSPLNIATDNGHESVVIVLRKHSEDQQTISK